MKPLRLLFLLLVGSLTLAGAAPAEADARFSKSLADTEVNATGLARLNSDQVAILDALVRRDLAAARRPARTERAALFSERLTADERANAGLNTLEPTELAELNARVQSLIVPPPPAGGYAVQRGLAGSPMTPSVKLRRGPEIHGSITLVVGAGSGGYSEYGGGIVLTYDDPEHNFGLAVGYSEMHSKGGYGYHRGGYYDGFGRRPFDPWWDSQW